MSIIFEEPYTFILAQQGDDWFLTFFTGGPIVIDFCVKLTQEEIAKVASSKEETARLANAFHANRSLSSGRRITPAIVSQY